MGGFGTADLDQYNEPFTAVVTVELWNLNIEPISLGSI